MKSYHIRMQPYGFDISILQQPLYLIYIGSEGQNKKSKHIKRRLCVVSNKMYPKEGGILWYKSAAITIKSWQFGE